MVRTYTGARVVFAAAPASVLVESVLIDDTVQMAARWHAAGGSRELRIWPDGVHGFNAFPIDLARLGNAAQFAFLDRIYAAA